jgi:transcriptional regulator
MAVSKHSNDRLQGTLDLLAPKSLASRGTMHGYGITLHIQQISNEALRVEEGSLYPELYRMTQAGWLKSEWGVSENNRRARFYSIAAAGRRQLAEEEDAEIEFRLQAQSRDNLAGGMSEPEARRDAARRFGDRTLLQEETRAANRIRFLEAAWQDPRYAFRGFRRNPGFTLTAVVSLALGIGANAALFSVIDTLLLKALPYGDPDHLVYVSGRAWTSEPRCRPLANELEAG